jgi:hypothetical protein
MEWLALVLLVGGGGWTARRWKNRRDEAQTRQRELGDIQRLADEDVTFLGEQLQRLDAEVGGRPMDEATRVDYQTALDAYESAQRAVPRIRAAEEISKITDTLSAGRYALACVQARMAGRPVPELRVACFFNPQHGPSVTEVLWTAPGQGTRKVPACAQDAARVAAHEAPEVRKVTVGQRKVPYWAAGDAFRPYTEGYFAASAAMAWAYLPPVPDLGGIDLGGGGVDLGGGGIDLGGGGMDLGGGGGDGGF